MARGHSWRARILAGCVLGLVVMVAGLDLAGPAWGAQCKVSLSVSGFPNADPSAGGAGVTVGDRVTMVARVTGCKLPSDTHLVVLRVGVDSLGRHIGRTVRAECAIPCRIHDRRTHASGYDYQVVLVRHGRTPVRSPWCESYGRPRAADPEAAAPEGAARGRWGRRTRRR